MKYGVGDRVLLDSGEEVELIKDINGVGFHARHLANGKKEQIRNEMIRSKLPPRPEGLWEDLAARVNQDNDPGQAPAALIAAVKVDRKIQYLPSYGAINAIPYLFQYTPLFALKRSPWGRILIADETGLGKTVEAGIILEELFRSKDPVETIGDALIIGTKSLQAEWESKLKNHFERPITPITAQDLVDRLTRRGDPPKGEFLYYLSMDAMPGLLKRGRMEEKDILAKNLFDMVIVDEAHNFKNPESKRRRALTRLLGAKLSNESAPASEATKPPKLLLLTATPLSTSIDNLFSYFTLMDPALSSMYGRERQLLAFKSEHHKVKLARRLSSLVFRLVYQPDDSVARARLLQFLDDPDHREKLLEVADDFEANEAFEMIRQFAEAPQDGQPEALGEALLQLDPWCDMIVRNTRRGVELQGDTQVRVKNLCVQLHPEETQKVNKVPFWAMEPLAEVTYRQMLASSVPGLVYRDAIHELAKTSADDAERSALDREEEEDPTGDYADADDKFQSQPLSISALHSLKDAKYEELLTTLKVFFDDQHQRGALLFTRFTATASYLWMRIRQQTQQGGLFPGLRVEYIHGKVPPDVRAERIQDLRDSGFEVPRGTEQDAPPPNYEGCVLVILTEVGQEGIDLQFCTGVFHYDLHWNPMRLVQRNGRVHRIGQRAPEVFIYTFFVEGSLDLRISQAISRRMQMVYETFGDLPDGLFGGEAGDSLKELGVEGNLQLLDLIQGKKSFNLDEEIERRVSRFEQETEQIKLHRDQIQKLLTDEAEATHAWRPLVEDALHGSFGSLERVLRQDVEALLAWSTRSGKNVSARLLDGEMGLWDLQWSHLAFDSDRTGAMGRAAKRALAKRNQMVAQVLSDDGKSRAPDLKPYQVLHLAHPIVAGIAAQTLKDFRRPILLAASGAVARPCALICLEFEIKDPSHDRIENRWFMLAPMDDAPLDAAWTRLPQRGSADRMKAVLADLDWWIALDGSVGTAALHGLREGLEQLHLSIREEEVDRRGRVEIKRRVRHLRHLKRVLEYWTQEERMRSFFVYQLQRRVDLMEIGAQPDADLDQIRRKTLPSAKGQHTTAKKELDRLTALQTQIQGEVQRFRTEGPQGIRVLVDDLNPGALLIIQPRRKA